MQKMIKKMAETALPAAVGDTLTEMAVASLICLKGLSFGPQFLLLA